MAAHTATKVFDTIELLEMILYELPTKDLLFAQGVCKTWKATIDNSKKLQQALFFQHIPVALLDDWDGYKIVNGKCEKYYLLVKNPLLVEVFEFLYHFKAEYGSASLEHRFRDSSRRGPANHPSWHIAGASWRKMLPTQPQLQDCFTIRHNGYEGNEEARMPRGLFKMGDMIHELNECVRSITRECRFSYVKQNWIFHHSRTLKHNKELEQLKDHHDGNSAYERNARSKCSDSKGAQDAIEEI